MKKQMMMLLAGSLPLVVVAADAAGEQFGNIDAGTITVVLLGCLALFLARRMQKR